MPTGHRLTKSAGNSSKANDMSLSNYGTSSPSAESRTRSRPRAWSMPKDHYYLVYIVFFLQGVGMLFPWNVFITASEYFHARLKGTVFVNNFENIFSFCYSFANLFFMVILVNYAHLEMFNMRTTVAIPQILTASIFAATTAMVEVSMSGSILFTVTTIFVLICGFTAALIQSGIFGLAGRFPSVYTQAVMSGQGVAGMSVSIISLASTLGTPCTGSSPSANVVERASFSYFLASTMVIVLTLLAFLALTRSDFAQHYAFSEAGSPRPGGSEEEDDDDKWEQGGGGGGGGGGPNLDDVLDDALLTPRTRRRIIEERKSIMHAPVFQPASPDTSTPTSKRGSKANSIGASPGTTSPGDVTPAGIRSGSRAGVVQPGVGSVTFPGDDDMSSLSSPTSKHPNHASFYQEQTELFLDEMEEERISTCDLISYIWRNCFSVMLTFAVTLSVFPGVTSEILSSSNLDNKRCPESGRFFGAGVWQAIFFLLFNGGDTLGRLLAALKQCVPKRYVFVLSLCRIVFIPLFLMCNVVANVPSITPSPNGTMIDSGDWSLLPSSSAAAAAAAAAADGIDPRLGFFSEDYWPIIFMCLLSVSNGYVASLEMMNGPSLVPDGQQSRAGTIMAFFLVLGLVVGSVGSFGVRAVACQCNPFVG